MAKSPLFRFFTGAFVLFALFGVSSAFSQPDDSLTYFGSRPLYNSGAKTSVVVDDFGWIDEYRIDGIESQLSSTIAEWNAGGIEYAAYFALGLIESDEAIAALGDTGRVMDLDGSYGSYFMWTRSAFTDYLIDAGKTAIDVGATYFVVDNGSPGLPVLSFDDEIIEAFRSYLETNYTSDELDSFGVDDIAAFDYREYLKSADGGSYTDSQSVADSVPGDGLWEAWLDHLHVLERAFWEEWTTALRSYAQNAYGKTIYISGNRSHQRGWATADLFDFVMAETFLDSLGYPYHNLDDLYKTSLSFGKRFWSWNFPANTGSMNGSNDPYGTLKITELSKVFAAETLASGGLYQIPIDWVSFTREDERLPDLLADTLRLPRLHPELFNLEVAGEIGVVYNEAYEVEAWADYLSGFQGTMALLGDLQRSYDVIVAAAPGRRDGTDPLLTTDLSGYKAIVLHKTRYLSDTQVSALETYLTNGGTIIGLASVADLDEYGEAADVSRTFDGYFGSDGTTTVGSGRVISFASELGDSYHGALATNGPGEFEWEITAQNTSDLSAYRSSFQSGVDTYVDYDFAAGVSRFVRTHRYRDEDGSMVYHLVNRDINMTELVTDQSINASSAVSATVAIPAGFDSSTAIISWVSVESPTPVTLSHSVSPGKLSFTLPAFEHWGILKVGTAGEASQSLDESPEANIDLFTATGGHRPDRKDENGAIAASYNYWRGGNHGVAPWDIPYMATDDIGLTSIKLYYRFSSDETTWSDWALHSTESISGQYAEGNFSFEGPDGEGYYQFRVQAVDDAGNEEVVTPRDEAGYGFDETEPDEPETGTATGFVDGAWVEDLTGFTITWALPADNLSGVGAANISLVTPSTTVDADSLEAGVFSWTPDLSSLVPGETHSVMYRVEDYAGNWNTSTAIFTFKYGSLPVEDITNVSVTAGDGELEVTWTVPDDEAYHHASISYRVNESGAAWQVAGNSISEVANSYTIDNLQNGTSYEVRLVPVTAGNLEGNIAQASGSFTPVEGSGGGDSVAAPSNLSLEDNTANVRLTWTDNSDNETGFRIEKRMVGAESWTIVATIGPEAQAFVENVNIGNDAWEYRVRAEGTSVHSEYSSVQQISRSGGGDPGQGGGGSEPTAPAIPTNVTATDNRTSVTVSWTDNSDDETGFAIVRRVLGSGSWNAAGTVGANVTTFVDSIDIADRTYEYRVSAEKGQYASNLSMIAEVSRSQSGSGTTLNLEYVASGMSIVEVIIASGMSLNELKAEIAEEIGVDTPGFTVFLGGMALTDGTETLQSLGFEDGDAFVVVNTSDVPGSTYADWIVDFLDGERSGIMPDDDLNGDLVNNATHYGLGLDPRQSAWTDGLPALRQVGDAWVVSHSINPDAIEVSVVLELSADGGKTWISAVENGFTKAIETDSGSGQSEVTWTATSLSSERLLLRVRGSLATQ